MSTPDERLAHAKEIIQTYNVLHGLVVSSFPDDTPLPPLTTRQMNLLISVKERDGISIKDLADRQGVTTSSVSTMVDRMVDSGILTREPNPDDRRGVIVRVSPDVRESLEPFERQALKMLVDLIERMGDGPARQLRKLHTRIREIIATDSANSRGRHTAKA